MPDIRTLTQVQQGTIRIVGVTGGTVRPARVETAIIHWEGDPYDGPYEFTPTQEAQVIQTRGKTVRDNFVINPIPQNYGLITWNGSVLTVS